MQLIIDIGNTRIKAGIFKQKELIHHMVFNTIEDFYSEQLIEKYNITNAIVCSVVKETDEFVNALSKQTHTILFKSDTPTPLTNQYQSKSTLGSDRMAAAIGGYSLFPNANVLVIDAGTCLKFNFTNQKNEYIGGAISPGLQMRFKALHHFTDCLPLVEVDEAYNQLIGTTTTESILSGVQLAMVNEAEGFIQQYQSNYDNLTVVLTGGDANFFEKRLKKPIFADPFILLKGLNEILYYNLIKA